MLFQTKIYSN